MRRGELYRVHRGSRHDPRDYRVFVVVSRQTLLDSRYSKAICAPVYSTFSGLSTQVALGVDEGLKHASSIHCDELVSIPKASLTHLVGTLPPPKLQALSRALSVALALDQPV